MNPTSPTTIPYLPDDISLLAVRSHAAIRPRHSAHDTPAWSDPDVRAVRRAVKTWLAHYDGLHPGHAYAVPVREVLATLRRDPRVTAPPAVVLANALNTDAIEVVTQRSHTIKAAS
ncbi:hypothetical protein BHE97_15290 [Aeromicrobium sp. PE09-221]|uniref:hypothetical protein n=1 Tax=Aeromicrobium sp. PE09-221 TaxID=1898043 RepID=UPI000B3E89EF|nr:hypothetical protein [Aeromicrobium sp. PE09-221]OUZ07753.1 hypothetical protein BHE97_15290 [Aeromicrobium sp. PE09-221]